MEEYNFIGAQYKDYGFLLEIDWKKKREIMEHKGARGNTRQFGNFRIFLSLKFYVKSVLENVEVLKLYFYAVVGALNSANSV